jgi:hypothetical protein
MRPASEENFGVDLLTESHPPAGGITDASWKTRVTVETSTGKTYSLDNRINISPHRLPDMDDLRLP